MKKNKNNKNLLLSLILQIALFTGLCAQEGNIVLKRSFDHLEWKEFEAKVEQDFNVRFFYLPEIIPQFYVRVDSDTSTLNHVLKQNFKKYGIDVFADNTGNYFLLRNRVLKTDIPASLINPPGKNLPKQEREQAMAEESYLTTKSEFVWREITIGSRKEGINKNKFLIKGRISSTANQEPVIGASLYVEELEKGTTTDTYGEFSLSLPKGEYTIRVSSIESQQVKYKVRILSGGTLNIQLEPKLHMLSEVVIKSDRFRHVKGTEMGIEKLSVKNIKEIPVVLGEKDINKVALLLPGIQSLGEGASGFNVRGSPADQNLFYIDRVPVYNTSHLFGFFSAFNSDAIDEFTLYKSKIPIKYGGRLASIFELKAKKGGNEKFSARGGISPVTGRLMIEGPLKKRKSSFLLAGRSTYSDWLLGMLNDPDIRNSSGNFADGIANFSLQLNNKNYLNIFAYGSHDKFKLADILNHEYDNLGASVAWRHVFSNKSDIDFSFVHSSYGFSEKNNEYDFASYKQSYTLEHDQFNAVYSLKLNNDHEVSIGVNSTRYTVQRGDYLPLKENSSVIPRSFQPEKALESALFISDLWKLNEKFTIEGGLRFNNYLYLGPQSINIYANGQPMLRENIIDSTYYGENELIESFNNMDYRLAANYLINEDLSVKASFNRIHQYIFLLSNTITISPTAIWKLSDPHIKPMSGNQISVGLYKNIWAGHLNASIEAYYKKVDRLVEYKDGADFTLNKYPETDVIQGELDAYGIEFMIKKPYGKLNGWFNYTYSHAQVKAINQARNEENNFGLSYPANYDKPHAVNLVANYKFSRRLSTSANIVYSTGRPITLPSAIYYQNGMEILQYSLRNEFRIPDYFRVDLSFTYEGNLKKEKFAHGSFVFSVYNLTGRRNAYSVYFRSEDGQIKGYKLSIFGTPIFSIAYNFKLGNYED